MLFRVKQDFITNLFKSNVPILWIENTIGEGMFFIRIKLHLFFILLFFSRDIDHIFKNFANIAFDYILFVFFQNNVCDNSGLLNFS